MIIDIIFNILVEGILKAIEDILKLWEEMS